MRTLNSTRRAPTLKKKNQQQTSRMKTRTRTWCGDQVWGVWPKKYRPDKSIKKFTTSLLGFGIVGPFKVPGRTKKQKSA